MYKRLIFLTISMLFLSVDVSAKIIRLEIPVFGNSSTYAILGYLIAFSGFIFLGYRVFVLRNELIKLKQQLDQQKTKHFNETENETLEIQNKQNIISLENERMKYQKLHRDKELANQTMDLIRKNKFLVKVTEELDKVNRLNSDESIKNKINTLIQKINKEIDNEKQWEVFETAFDDVHEDFLKRLKQKYPSLTPKELKLCAYLRLNISTKELAPLMNISIRGVEICRYRVRKKLDINRDESLTKMIMDL
jgi:DNA-binding CsgD family transcriptional regulator